MNGELHKILAYHPILKWNHENFITLKTTLRNCLPHIRYFQMPGKDIANYVQPYQQILEKKLWKDIMKK